jgi:hypothetical protein
LIGVSIFIITRALMAAILLPHGDMCVCIAAVTLGQRELI